MTIIIIFSTPLYVNYKYTRPDIELHTSGVPVLNNVIAPYNVVCTSSIPIYINQPEIINVIELTAESWHLITSLARRQWNLALTISNQTLNFNLRLHLWHSQCHWNPTQPCWCGFHTRCHNFTTQERCKYCYWFYNSAIGFGEKKTLLHLGRIYVLSLNLVDTLQAHYTVTYFSHKLHSTQFNFFNTFYTFI